MMSKADLISEFAEKNGLSKAKAKIYLSTLQSIVFEHMKDEEVKLFDGITLTSVFQDAKVMKNNLTGEAIEIGAKYVPKVKFGTPIKNFLNN